MGTSITRTIIIGSRPSQLARWQSEHILAQLQMAWPEKSFQVVTRMTEGDRVLDRPLPEIGGKGVFTEELEIALRAGEIDLAVHSLKDLPVDQAPGLTIGAVGIRADARDVFISAGGGKLSDLPLGARVGTSSLRRQAQLKALRPDLMTLSLRGNVDTRIRKAQQGDYDGILLAAAGVERLDLQASISEYLSFEIMLPAPGQGALAVQCRAGDEEIQQLLRPVHDDATSRAVTAERAFLSELGGGCSAPIAAYATLNEAVITMEGLVASSDGRRVIRAAASGEDPLELGARLARIALEQGAREVLA